MTIKAIETRYNGYLFRSRLEARWAVFFDTLGIPYEYEPQGFDLGEAGRYLPDFWLPQQKTWVEIKPGAPSEEDEKKIDAFHGWSEESGCCERNLAIFVGNIPSPEGNGEGFCGVYWDWNGEWYADGWITVCCDNCYRWCACRTGKHFDIQFEARGDRINCGCPGHVAGGRGYSGNHPAILAAYAAARSARFEFGQTPRRATP